VDALAEGQDSIDGRVKWSTSGGPADDRRPCEVRSTAGAVVAVDLNPVFEDEGETTSSPDCPTTVQQHTVHERL
jgi:hypothetical protein